MKNKLSGLIFIFFLLVAEHDCFSQSEDFFEGVLHNTFILLDSSGNKKYFPWEQSIDHYDKTHILQKIISGRMDHLNLAMHLDSEKPALYEIDYDQKVVRKLNRQEAKRIEPLEFEKRGETELLGYLCEIYFLKFIYENQVLYDLTQSSPSTISRTYFIAKDLKILNAQVFAGLQENRNTMLFDGRFNAVALKVIDVFPNGDTLVINTIKVDERDVQEEIKLPAYPVRE